MLGPRLEQIPDAEPTFRVESFYQGFREVHDEILDYLDAVVLARDVWKYSQPLDRVLIVKERTGATRLVLDEYGAFCVVE